MVVLKAVNWVHKLVVWMADCRARRMVVLRVGLMAD